MTVAKIETNVEDGSTRITLSGENDLANAVAVQDELVAAVSHQATLLTPPAADVSPRKLSDLR